MSDDIFERVSRLIEEFQKQASTEGKKPEHPASVKKSFEIGDLEEYDVGKRVKPKDFDLSKETEILLQDTLPNNPSVSEVEEGDPQTDVETAYPSSPNPEIAEGDEPDVEEVRQPEGGEDVLDEKEGSLSKLSTAALLKKMASVLEQLLRAYAIVEPTKTVIKSGAIDKTTVAAYEVADIIKQAEYDADLLFGYLMGFTKAAEETLEDATQPQPPAASQTPEQGAAEQPVAAETVNNPPAEQATEEADPAAVLADASPDEIAEVLSEDPELAAAVAQTVAQIAPDEVVEALTEDVPGDVLEQAVVQDPALAAAVAEAMDQEAKEAAWRKLAEDDPMEVLADATPEEIAEVLQEDPELAMAVGMAMGGVPFAGEETPAEELAEGHGTESVKEEEKSESEEETESEPSEESSSEEGEKEGSVNPEKASTLAKIAALSSVLAEEQITPDELAFFASASPNARDAIKVANAVRNFRAKYRNKRIKEAESPNLKAYMRQFLQELLT